MKPEGRPSFVKSTMEGRDARGERISSHGRGCFEAYQACKACQANVDGLFCNFKAYHPPPWYALKSGFGPMFAGLGTAVRFEKQGQKLGHEFRESPN